MRLLEQTDTDWASLAPYMDTLCLPVYRYQVEQKELRVDEAELIAYISEELEKRLIGRILLLPGYGLLGDDDALLAQALKSVDEQLVHSGFHYSFLVILDGTWQIEDKNTSFHVLSVQKDVDRQLELERLYEEILSVWQSV